MNNNEFVLTDDINATDFEQQVDEIITLAEKCGATSCEVTSTFDQGIASTVRLGQVDTIEFHRDKYVGITVYIDNRRGYVSTSDTAKDSIESAVKAACKIAEYTESDPFSGLAEKEYLAQEIWDLDLFHPRKFSTADTINYAKTCEQAALAYDESIKNSEGATFLATQRIRAYGNSNDFIGTYVSTKYMLSSSVIAQRDESMQRDFEYTLACDFNQLEDFASIGARAAEKVVSRLNPKKIKTCVVPIIFSPQVARSLLGSFVSAISGSNLYRGSSFLLDSLGKQIFPDFINIREYPHIKKKLGSCCFDADGVATKTHSIVTDGILESYVLSTYTARKLNLITTGNSGGVHNLTLETNLTPYQDLLQELNTGILVTEVMGHGVNVVTGDYSRGAAGFWVENGEIQYPVAEITIAGNLRDILLGIVAVGDDVDRRSNIVTGSLLVNKITVAGD